MSENYELARRMYMELGVDTESALQKLQTIPVSIHCWQIDDLSGFEEPERGLSGGIAAIGNAPGVVSVTGVGTRSKEVGSPCDLLK